MRDDLTTTATEPPPNFRDAEIHQLPVATPNHNQAAEAAVLGAILLAPQVLTKLDGHLEPGDFYQPRHETIWDAIHHVHAAGTLPDPVTVADRLHRDGNLIKIGGAPYLHDLMEACPNPSNGLEYAAGVRNAARIRLVETTATRLTNIVKQATPDGIDMAVAEALQTLDDTAARVGPANRTIIRIPTIDDILAGDEEDTYDWVIPGLIEHQERIILTAEEGAGKSTLLRQIGITAAAGIHPFTGQEIPPVSVLHVDVENSLRQSRRRYRPLRIQAAERLDPNNLHIELRVAGIDLTSPEDVDWLTKTCISVHPQLLLIGPIYKLANGDPTEETSAKPVAIALDQIRDKTDCALILEAHVAKSPSGSKKRPHEPYGWSGWMRWPEIGIYLDKDGKLTHWRGAREEREWPQKLERGGHWPWTPSLTKPDELWIAIQKARQDAGKPLTMRDLETATGMGRSTIHRLVGAGGKYAHGWPGFNNAHLMGDTKK